MLGLPAAALGLEVITVKELARAIAAAAGSTYELVARENRKFDIT